MRKSDLRTETARDYYGGQFVAINAPPALGLACFRPATDGWVTASIEIYLSYGGKIYE
jgi:hypothetical protein